jgi:hypothetical protein
VFKLQAKVFGGMLGEINKLWIDPNQPVAGAVDVFIVRNPLEVGGLQHEPGAAQVKQIDIRSASGGGVVRELRITSNLAADAPVYVFGMDTCAVGGSVLRDVIVSGAITGPLTITGMLKANVSCGSLQNLTVRAAAGGSLACPRGSEAASCRSRLGGRFLWARFEFGRCGSPSPFTAERELGRYNRAARQEPRPP